MTPSWSLLAFLPFWRQDKRPWKHEKTFRRCFKKSDVIRRSTFVVTTEGWKTAQAPTNSHQFLHVDKCMYTLILTHKLREDCCCSWGRRRRIVTKVHKEFTKVKFQAGQRDVYCLKSVRACGCASMNVWMSVMSWLHECGCMYSM